MYLSLAQPLPKTKTAATCSVMTSSQLLALTDCDLLTLLEYATRWYDYRTLRQLNHLLLVQLLAVDDEVRGARPIQRQIEQQTYRAASILREFRKRASRLRDGLCRRDNIARGWIVRPGGRGGAQVPIESPVGA